MKTRLFSGVVVLAPLAWGAICLGEDEILGRDRTASFMQVRPRSKSKQKPAFPMEKASARISGRVAFDGDPPKPKHLPIKGDEFCEHHAAENPPKDESLLVNDDKSLRNVFVYVKKGANQWKFDVPSDAVVVTQKNCMYHPHVIGLQARQALQVASQDDTTHNVHFIAKKNREFNLTQRKGQKDEWTLARPEVGTAFLKCDVHDWMRAYVCIVRHPFYAVTGDGGTFELGKLPPGEYEVEAWHEKLGTQSQTVTLTDGQAATLEFRFTAQ